MGLHTRGTSDRPRPLDDHQLQAPTILPERHPCTVGHKDSFEETAPSLGSARLTPEGTLGNAAYSIDLQLLPQRPALDDRSTSGRIALTSSRAGMVCQYLEECKDGDTRTSPAGLRRQGRAPAACAVSPTADRGCRGLLESPICATHWPLLSARPAEPRAGWRSTGPLVSRDWPWGKHGNFFVTHKKPPGGRRTRREEPQIPLQRSHLPIDAPSGAHVAPPPAQLARLPFPARLRVCVGAVCCVAGPISRPRARSADSTSGSAFTAST